MVLAAEEVQYLLAKIKEIPFSSYTVHHLDFLYHLCLNPGPDENVCYIYVSFFTV